MKKVVTVLYLFLLINLNFSNIINDKKATFNEIKLKIFERFRKYKIHSIFYLYSDEETENQGSILDNINQTCFNEKLKFPEYHSKVVSEIKGSIAVDLATILCNKKLNEIFDRTFLKNFDLNKQQEYFRQEENCIKLKLNETEMNSDLIKNFNLNEEEIENCKNNSGIYKNLDNPKLKISFVCSCDHEAAFKAHKIKIIRAILMALTENKNSLKVYNEMLKNRKISKDFYEKYLECLMNDFK